MHSKERKCLPDGDADRREHVPAKCSGTKARSSGRRLTDDVSLGACFGILAAAPAPENSVRLLLASDS